MADADESALEKIAPLPVPRIMELEARVAALEAQLTAHEDLHHIVGEAIQDVLDHPGTRAAEALARARARSRAHLDAVSRH